jgi:hypothetical protein
MLFQEKIFNHQEIPNTFVYKRQLHIASFG